MKKYIKIKIPLLLKPQAPSNVMAELLLEVESERIEKEQKILIANGILKAHEKIMSKLVKKVNKELAVIDVKFKHSSSYGNYDTGSHIRYHVALLVEKHKCISQYIELSGNADKYLITAGDSGYHHFTKKHPYNKSYVVNYVDDVLRIMKSKLKDYMHYRNS